MNTDHDKPFVLNHPQASLLAQQARAAFDRSDYSTAERLTRRALVLCPSSASTHTLLAVILTQVGRTQEALDPLRQAMELDPTDPASHCGLAVACYKLNRLEESLRALERLFSQPTRTDPEHAELFDTASEIYFEVQRTLAHQRRAEVDQAVGQLRRSAEKLTGYPVRIVTGPHSPASDASLKIAALSGKDHHLISCSSDLPPLIRPCALANELAYIHLEFEAAAAGKARRFFRTDRTKRFMSGFYAQQKERLGRRGWTNDQIEHAVTEDSGYLVAVLLNRPIALNAEYWLRRHVPCLSAAQFLAFHDYQQTLPDLSQILGQPHFLRPRSLDLISLALSGFDALEHDAWFAGATTFAKRYRTGEVLPLSEKLWHHWRSVAPSLAAGDEYALVDAFANIVGLGDAYESRTYSR